jgi:DNA-binding NarL/FixJ family response regulator
MSESHETKGGLSIGPLVIVHKRALNRECLARSLYRHNPALGIVAVGSLEELRALPHQAEPSAVLLVLGERKATDATTREELKEFVLEFGEIPVILLADVDAPAEILAALEGGAKGFIPTSENVKVLIGGIALARAGGIFVPASAVSRLKDAIDANQANARPSADFLTMRQTSVANALRQGKANKIIAYELNMCESTVKVHIRTIMKKLNATNRTQVAYKLHEMLGTAHIQ